MKDFIFIFL